MSHWLVGPRSRRVKLALFIIRTRANSIWIKLYWFPTEVGTGKAISGYVFHLLWVYLPAYLWLVDVPAATWLAFDSDCLAIYSLTPSPEDQVSTSVSSSIRYRRSSGTPINCPLDGSPVFAFLALAEARLVCCFVIRFSKSCGSLGTGLGIQQAIQVTSRVSRIFRAHIIASRLSVHHLRKKLKK